MSGAWLSDFLRQAREGRWSPPSREHAERLSAVSDFAVLREAAAALRDSGFGHQVTYSRKVFIPLTELCRDVCHYCTSAHPPRKGERAFMTADEILAVARAGAEAGCKEALFTLGDKPELRYRVAREELAELGHDTTLSYLREMALRGLAIERAVEGGRGTHEAERAVIVASLLPILGLEGP